LNKGFTKHRNRKNGKNEMLSLEQRIYKKTEIGKNVRMKCSLWNKGFTKNKNRKKM
jgi:hypothetical protein